MKPRQPCGTHAAFNRHKAAGQKPCQACWHGERTYQRLRARRRRAAARQVDGQRPIVASIPTTPKLEPRPQPAGVIASEVLDAFNAALRGDYTVSFTRQDGLRIHLDPMVADDWIAAAPMADDDQLLAPVHHLPVSWTA